MITAPIILNKTNTANLPGSSGTKLFFVPRAIGPGWGFSVAPLLDVNGEFLRGGLNNTNYKFRWLNNAYPNIPGSLPVYVEIAFKDGSQRLIRVTDNRFYRFEKPFSYCNLYASNHRSFNVPFEAVEGTINYYYIAHVLETQHEGYGSGTGPWQEALTSFSPLNLQVFGSPGPLPPFYTLLNSLASPVAMGPPGKLVNAINAFGFDDAETASPQSTAQNFDWFFVFPQYRRWRMHLRAIVGDGTNTAGVAVPLIICSSGVAGEAGNQDAATGQQFVVNEQIDVSQWTTDVANGDRICLERECKFVGEWIAVFAVYAGAAPAGPTVEIAQMELCFVQ